ncbi:hypothetical protein GOV12_08135 [Candidatus Pacearchaeota archaeon]|nr:hypothetical protein [Candidatus Pacearchaeota archaeon]
MEYKNFFPHFVTTADDLKTDSKESVQKLEKLLSDIDGVIEVKPSSKISVNVYQSEDITQIIPRNPEVIKGIEVYSEQDFKKAVITRATPGGIFIRTIDSSSDESPNSSNNYSISFTNEPVNFQSYEGEDKWKPEIQASSQEDYKKLLLSLRHLSKVVRLGGSVYSFESCSISNGDVSLFPNKESILSLVEPKTPLDEYDIDITFASQDVVHLETSEDIPYKCFKMFFKPLNNT